MPTTVVVLLLWLSSVLPVPVCALALLPPPTVGAHAVVHKPGHKLSQALV